MFPLEKDRGCLGRRNYVAETASPCCLYSLFSIQGEVFEADIPQSKARLDPGAVRTLKQLYL